jgi:hypothetical protein
VNRKEHTNAPGALDPLGPMLASRFAFAIGFWSLIQGPTDAADTLDETASAAIEDAAKTRILLTLIEPIDWKEVNRDREIDDHEGRRSGRSSTRITSSRYLCIPAIRAITKAHVHAGMPVGSEETIKHAVP